MTFMKLLWPDVSRKEGAELALREGVTGCVLLSLVTAILSTSNLLYGSNFARLDAWSYIDAVIFMILAWGIFRQSKVAAVLALALFCVEKIEQFAHQSRPFAFSDVGVIFILFLFINGARGAFSPWHLRAKHSG